MWIEKLAENGKGLGESGRGVGLFKMGFGVDGLRKARAEVGVALILANVGVAICR